jgi:hypothetical protein
MEISRPHGSLLMIAGLSAALFLPIMGRGFIHDDFVHLYSAAYHPLRRGLAYANGGPFYTPITWLTFKLDWILWGKNSFLMALGNLLLHIANITLLYAFALKLWRSQVAARWTALGFALLFPANTWAVMWISTRAHLLVTFFYLAAMLATLWLSRAERHKKLAVVTIVLFASLAAFSKESGVTTPVGVALTLIYVRRSQWGKILPLSTVIGLFGLLIAAIAAYALMRGRSGAIPITFSANDWYSYATSLSVLFENFFRYGWRTYGLLGIMASAIALSQIIRGRRPRLDSLTMNDALLSASLFATAISPFILLRGRSGIYTYLPGIAAALLLGAMARAFYDAPLKEKGREEKKERQGDGDTEMRIFRLSLGPSAPRPLSLLERFADQCSGSPACLPRIGYERDHRGRHVGPPLPYTRLQTALVMAPVLLVIALYSLFTVVHSLRWMRMAEINTFVLNQTAERVIRPEPNTLFILTYSEADNVNGFPDSLAYGFSCALRVLYADPTLSGSIGRQGESRCTNGQLAVICLAYIHSGDGAPRLVIGSDESCVF